jgi:hypothetical protein
VVFFTVLNALPTVVLFAMGLPALHRHAVFASAAAMLVSVYPACRFMGPVGGQIATLFATLIGYLLQLILLRSVTGLSLIRYGSGFVSPALGSVAMLAIVLGGRSLALTHKPLADLTVCAVSCLMAYAMCAPVLLRASKVEISLNPKAETKESANAL